MFYYTFLQETLQIHSKHVGSDFKMLKYQSANQYNQIAVYVFKH